MALQFQINGEKVKVDKQLADKPLLWFLREDKKLTGTKFGCGIGQCGACTVHVNGTALRSCSLPLAAVDGSDILTIEGLADSYEKAALHPVQQAWLDEDVAQCGYCQAGQIMQAAALLKVKPKPDDDDINLSMTNICRCGSYPRIRKAIKRASFYEAN